MTIDRLPTRLLGFLALLQFTSCAYMSQVGPQKSVIESDTQEGYQLIEVKTRADIPSGGRSYGQADLPSSVRGGGYSDKIRPRDTLHFVITDLTELSPFYNPRGEPFAYGPVEVAEDGGVSVPYLGEIQVIGRTLADVSRELNDKAKPVSSTAQVSVSRSDRIERTANVIGEVKRPGPVPLQRKGITSLDLLAASGGPVESEHLYKYVLRREGRDHAFDYLGFRQRPFPVEEGDLLSVSTDLANRFYVMGAINKPTTVAFPVPSPTLADALGAASGFDERRSDPSGVFIFRKGSPDQVFTLNLKDPGAMFLTQRFPIRGEDLVYVTEAPLARWNRLIAQLLPYTQISQAAYNLDRIGR
ncbi:MAG: polysaccharide biosynthesis/export family protein [Verrucomicrobiota bacterium]